jgi:hypothetical protein
VLVFVATRTTSEVAYDSGSYTRTHRRTCRASES